MQSPAHGTEPIEIVIEVDTLPVACFELFTAGFKGAEVDLISELIEELDAIETHTDEQQTQIRSALFRIEKTLDPIDAIFLYEVIQLTGEIADMAERVGRRLELLLS